jgi:hypothetical protein
MGKTLRRDYEIGLGTQQATAGCQGRNYQMETAILIRGESLEQ